MDWSNPAFVLWAKSDRKSPGRWHPLIGHCLDVAASFWVLLERETDTTKALFADELKLPVEALLPWGAALAGLHDIGKAMPYFQMQWKKKDLLVAADTLRAHSYIWSALHTEGDLIPHATGSQAILKKTLVDHGLTSEGAQWIADALGAHHGYRAAGTEVRTAQKMLASGTWTEARTWLQQQIVSATGADAFPPPQMGAVTGVPFVRFAGLVSVADWIGSNPAFFQPRGVIEEELLHDLTDTHLYFKMALAQAKHGLNTIGWRGQKPQRRTFAETFKFSPRALQDMTIQALDGVNRPALLLIEAPMGEGKTEAALYAHHLLQRQVGHRGLYFALPTQATSDQMFKRVHEFLTMLGFKIPPDLQLVHGAAFLSKQFRELQLNVGDEESLFKQSVVASEWFTPKKQALLSPHGVGTVDQALFGVLNVGHHFVRLYGLANRTIVFDEVHAYELYTSKLMQRLIAWLHALGSSVVLLSATLPCAARQALLSAYGAPALQTGDDQPYPRLIRVVEGEMKSFSLNARELHYSLDEAPADSEALAQFLIEQAEGGGAVGCVVNTVARAQIVFQHVTTLLQTHPNAPELLLLHARFPSWQRQEITERLIQRVGTKTLKRRDIIVVATQVIEQSIDVDFDVLVSDLAPLDLLLQRAGRLYRHDDPTTFQRPRPPKHDRARLYISGLAPEAEVPDLTTYHWHYVYAPAVLLRTWAVLRQRKDLHLPNDLNDLPQQSSLLEQVYSDAKLPGRFSSVFESSLAQAEQKLADERKAEEDLARDQLLPLPEAFFDQPIEDREFTDDDDPRTHARLRAVTRLGEPSITVVPLFHRHGAMYLSREGKLLIDLDKKPSLDDARELLRHAVGLSNRAVYAHLTSQNPPKIWQQSALLRHVRVIELEEEEYVINEKLRIRLHPMLGVEYVHDAT